MSSGVTHLQRQLPQATDSPRTVTPSGPQFETSRHTPRRIRVLDLGLLHYGDALRLQTESVDRLVEARRRGLETASFERLIVCQHPTVITVGRGIGAQAEVLDARLPVVEVSRGGRSTLHLPGQIVIYPIIDLKARGSDLHGFIRGLEVAIMQALKEFSISANIIAGQTGVWVEGVSKIASIGIAVRQGTTFHGLALNVDCDLSVFGALRPCGFSSDVMTSVKKCLDRSEDQSISGVALANAMVSGSLVRPVQARLVEKLQKVLCVSHRH